MKLKLPGITPKSKIGKRLMDEPRYRVIFAAVCGFSLNLLYAAYNGILAVQGRSLWFAVMCAYYAILSTMRFSAVLCGRKGDGGASVKTELFITKFSGVLLVVLSAVLTGVIYISLSQNIAAKYNKIIMITIAVYTFGKFTAAVIRAVKQHHDPSPLFAAIRGIGYVETAVSVLTLQRSMLASFGTMSGTKAHVLNTAAGAAVCLFVLVLGIAMLMKKERVNDYGKI
ncbi:MAG: hypothetical protein Q4G07_09720 [Oscillospiraceae bacterium]|nr:hypothetical protein [Oscillospiraceae bacterium]